MSLDYPGLLDDLHQESQDLIACLRELAADQWADATPAPGWTIHDQVSHLAFFDQTTLLALTDPEKFRLKPSASWPTGWTCLTASPPNTATCPRGAVAVVRR